MIIDEVKVLEFDVNDRKLLSAEEAKWLYLPRGGASSVGALRDRSGRFFDTACSRNEDLLFVRRLREKLSVCDLLTFLPNILDRSVYRNRERGFQRYDSYHRNNDENGVEIDEMNRFDQIVLPQEIRREDMVGDVPAIYTGSKPRIGIAGKNTVQTQGSSGDAIPCNHLNTHWTPKHMTLRSGALICCLARKLSQLPGRVQDFGVQSGEGWENVW